MKPSFVPRSLTACRLLLATVLAGAMVSSHAAPQYVFSARTDVGTELWVTDGTAVGTELLRDINPGEQTPTGARSGAPNLYVALGDGRVVFVATNYLTGTELWVTDGTGGGTALLKDIRPGAQSSNPSQLTLLNNGSVVFAADDGTTGQELWITDGTTDGTRRVKDIRPGANGSSISLLTKLANGKALFVADNGTAGAELWITNGSDAGTTLVKAINSGAAGSSIGEIFVYTSGDAFFSADNGTTGVELWRTNGTAGGTALFKEIAPGAAGSNPSKFCRFGDGSFFLFSANDGTHGIEPWVSDASAANTVILADVNPTGDSSPQNFFPAGQFYAGFSADDGTHRRELWLTDGSQANTVLKDISSSPTSGSNPSRGYALPSGVSVFSATDTTHGTEVWATDGTIDGTILLKDINPGTTDSMSLLAAASFDGDRLIFSASDPDHGSEAWVTDGTPEGTQFFAEIWPGIADAQPSAFTSLGDFNGGEFTPRFTNGVPSLTVTAGAPAENINQQLRISDLATNRAIEWFQCTAPQHGTLIFTNATANTGFGESDILPAGTVTYQATPGYSGSDEFTVHVSDGYAMDTVLVTVTVLPGAPNTAPIFVGANPTFVVARNSSNKDFSNQAHVSDPNSGQTLTWSSQTAPSHGTVNINATAFAGGSDIAPGSALTYTPTTNYTGSDSFTIKVSDGSASATRVISVNVIVDSTAPTLIDKSPTDNATNVAPDAYIELYFSESVRAGTGNIILRPNTGADITIPVGDTDQVTFDDTAVYIKPTADLSPGKSYDVIIASGVIVDAAGNPFAGIAVDALDFSVPLPLAVASITRHLPQSSPQTAASRVTYRVLFSGTANSVDPTDFVLTTTGSATGTVASVTGSGALYFVTVTNLSGTGTVRLDLKTTASITDANSASIGSAGYTAGESFTRVAAAEAFAWGSNLGGQLGDGTRTQRNAPVAVDRSSNSALAGKTIVALASGTYHTLALAADGTVYAWGSNTSGSLGNNSTTDSLSPVAVGGLSGKTIVAIAASDGSSYALASDGTAYAWGNNSSSALGDGTTTNRLLPVAVSTENGLSSLAGKFVVAIAAGGAHGLALASDGTVHAWGLNNAGQLGDNTTTNRSRPVAVNVASGTSALFGKTVVALSAGSTHSLALASDGTVYTWGNNFNFQIGNGAAVNAGPFKAPVAVSTTGTALAGKTVTAISAGAFHNLALASDGTLVAWGTNTSGEFGNNSTTDSNVPVSVPLAGTALAGKTLVAISAGSGFSGALAADGTVATWGGNSEGMLGDNSTTNRLTPGAINTTHGVSDLYGGQAYALSVSSLNSHVAVVGHAVDTLAPSLLASYPVDSDTNIFPDENITLTFDEKVKAGTGSIILRPATGGDVTIPVTDAAQVSFSGTTVTINPTANLTPSTAYAVLLGSGVVTDLSGNAFAGLGAGALDFVSSIEQTTIVDSTSGGTATFGGTTTSTNISPTGWLAKTFSAPGSGTWTLTGVRIPLARNAAPADTNIRVRLFATDSGGAPTGAALATATTSLTTQTSGFIYHIVKFTGSGWTLASGATYALVFDATAGAPAWVFAAPTYTTTNGFSFVGTSYSNNNGPWTTTTQTQALQLFGRVEDTTGPTFASSTPAPNGTGFSESGNLVLTFNEDVRAGTGNIILRPASGSDVTIDVTDAAQVSFSGKSVTINPTANLGSLTGYSVVVASGVILDTAGNAFAGLAVNDLKFTTGDSVAPVIASVTAPASKTYGSGQNVDFTVNFNEAVNVTGSPQLALTVGSTARQAVYSSGTGTTALVFRYVPVSPDLDTDGVAAAASLTLNSGTIKDLAGNPATLTFTTPGTTGIKVDAVAPVVTNVTSSTANNTYATGAAISIQVTFSKTVTVTNAPRLLLETGATDRNASYSTGSGSNTLTFTYTVQNGDTSSDLNYASTSALTLNGGTIKDAAGNAATLTLPALTGAGSLATNKALVINPAPTIVSVSPPAGGTYTTGDTLDFVVTYSAPVTVSIADGTPVLSITIGTARRGAYYVSGSGSTALVFRYTVRPGENDGNGIALSSPIALVDGTIQSAASVDAELDYTEPNTAAVRVDTPPIATAIRKLSPVVTGLVPGVVTWRVSFSEPVTGVNAADFTLVKTQAAYGVIDSVTPVTPTNTSEFDVVVAGVSGAGTLRLDLNASGTGIADAGGKPIVGGFTVGQIYASLAASSPVGWGHNLYGRLGDNTNTDRHVPVAVKTDGKLAGKYLVDVVAGGYFGLGLTADGLVYSWGNNDSGQLGIGTNGDWFAPQPVKTDGVLAGKTIVAIAGGGYHALALDSDGKVYAWGRNTNGQLGNGSNTNSNIPVAVNMTGVLAGKKVVAIAAGDEFSVALTSDGRVYTWGDGGDGQLGHGDYVDYLNAPVAVSTSGALASKTVIAIAAGSEHVLALTTEGRVYAWGNNGFGQLGTFRYGTNQSGPVPVYHDGGSTAFGAKTITAIACGWDHSIALASDGRIYVWGENDHGQVGDNTTINRRQPALVNNAGVLAGKSIVAVTGGDSHTTALDADGKVYDWGFDDYGQLGNNTVGTDTKLPVAVDATGVLAGKTVVSLGTNWGGVFNLALAVSTTGPRVRQVDVPAVATYRAGDTLDFTVSWNNAVTVTGGTPKLAFTVGSASREAVYVSGSGTDKLVFRYTVAAGDNGALAITSPLALGGGTIQDGAALAATLAFSPPSTNNRLVDTTAPTVNRLTRDQTTPTSGDTVSFSIIFSESVDGVDADDFSVVRSGTVTGSVAGVSQVSGSIYVVTVEGVGGLGTLRLDLKSSGTGITDRVGNPIASGYTGETFDVDRVFAVVTGVTSDATDGTLKIGATATIQVNFSEAVTVSGTPQLTLETGTVDRTLSYTGGSGTATLTFDYVVQAGDVSADLDYVDTGSLALNGGTILDATGLTAVLTLPVPGASGSLGANQALVVDGVAPSATSIARQNPATDSIGATSATFRVTFSETVTGVTADDFALTFSGGTSASIGVVTPVSGTTYDVAVSTIAGAGSFRLDLKASGTGIEDTAHNAIAAGLNGEVYTVLPAPTITSGLTASSGYGSSFGYTIAGTNLPGSFTATGLPAGLTLNTATGVISGAPTVAGSFNVTIGARNAGGTGTATLVLTVVKTNATVTLANLEQVYSGEPRAVNVTTNPPGLDMLVSYGAESTAPTLAGEYAVTATIVSPAYQGSATGTLVVRKAPQTIAFTAPAITLGVPVAITATASSGGAVSISVVRGDASIGGGRLLVATSGVVTLGFTQAGDANYLPVSTEISLGEIAKLPQSIAFTPPAVTIGAVATLSATATSGLPVTFSVVSGDAKIENGNQLTVTGPGLVKLRASVGGNAVYQAASLDVTLGEIAKLTQTIEFAALADKTTNDGSFTLSATASSGLPVSFVVTTGSPAMISGNTLTFTGVPGTVEVRASQGGNATYAAAPDVVRSFTVTSAGPRVFIGDVVANGGMTDVGDIGAVLPPTGNDGNIVIVAPNLDLDLAFDFTLRPDLTFVKFITIDDALLVSVDTPRIAAATRTLTLHGQLVGNILSGRFDEIDLAFSTTVQGRGSSTSVAGFYASDAINSAAGGTSTIVGNHGEVVSVTNIGSGAIGGRTTLDANGGFTIASGTTTVTGKIDAPTTTVSGTISQPGKPDTNFSGVASTTLRTDRVINLSSRARIGPSGDRTLITGFVIGGSESKRVLLRAIGPALANYGVGGVLANPKLRLFDGTQKLIYENDDWSGADTSAAFGQTGAFALPAGSRDAALVVTLAPGAYTMHIVDGGEIGVAMAEIYDASANPQGEYQRLINISSRGTVEAGDGTLIGGFVVTGNSPKRVLVRGVGPTLANYGVTTALADPKLSIFSGQTVIAQNDNWETPTAINANQTPATGAEIAAAAGGTGAFALPAGSKDAAIVITLAPGAYTAQVQSATGQTGVALVEIYEIPE